MLADVKEREPSCSRSRRSLADCVAFTLIAREEKTRSEVFPERIAQHVGEGDKPASAW